MGGHEGQDARGVLGTQRQAALYEAVLQALTDAPTFRVAYRAAVLETVEGHCMAVEPSEDEPVWRTRARAAALPEMVSWLTGHAPALGALPADLLQAWVLFVTPWIVLPVGEPPRLRVAPVVPTAPLDARPHPDEPLASYRDRAFRAWLDAARTAPTVTDRMRAGAQHLTADQAWATVRPWPGLDTHARWWVAARVEGRSFSEIAAARLQDRSDTIYRRVRDIDARLGYTGAPATPRLDRLPDVRHGRRRRQDMEHARILDVLRQIGRCHVNTLAVALPEPYSVRHFGRLLRVYAARGTVRRHADDTWAVV